MSVLFGALGAALLAAPASAEVLGGSVSGDRFGEAASPAGDLNGDGLQDFLVGAPGGRGQAGITGTVSVFLGESGAFPDTAAVVLEGEVGGDEFGFAVASAGDVDGDGFDDLVVGAPRHDSVGLDAGRVYLFLGGASPAWIPARSWDGDLAGARFGAALAGGLDFNGDGLGDFAAGAPGSNVGATRAGRVEIYLGNASAASIAQPAAFAMNGDAANWELGFSLDGAGDVNNDGFGDLVLGAPQLQDSNSGRAVVWFGQTSTVTAPTRAVLSGEVGGDRFGFAVSGAGDRNEDGFDEVLVGAPGHDSQGADKGAVYAFLGGASLDLGFDWKTLGEVGGDSLGYAVDGGFDLDQDGLPDLAAGAPGADSPAAGAGETRLFLGSSHPAVVADRILFAMAPASGFEAGDRSGSVVRFIGSANGDAYEDLLIGAPSGNLLSGVPAGTVGIFAGSSNPTPVRLLELSVTEGGAGAEVRWILADAHELAGLRVRVDRGAGWVALHDGWLPSVVDRFLDASGIRGARTYALEGLSRVGAIGLLGTLRMEGGSEGLTGTVGVRARENPFRTRVALAVTLPEGPVRVDVLEVGGRRVRLLWEGTGAGEIRELAWDGRDERGLPAPPGVYFVAVRGLRSAAATRILRLP